ncbi:HD domain-containing protein [Nonomuraea gerenzanensis]|uniref:Putative cyanamide hydratase n=1 Tax=Nonomuraea gerenzanensis TaxID=93944 RepID=A0A1M4E5W5_9ACTN|nr:HD domain-containing protein [Nonomuraea gerenzanensis]UBU16371.1 HD domain-containing protein [Nonomuraea gerenzanensis]SBO94190.1 Putative cyanamide hydratase [Nonomuraea gerenzanensis]
MLPTVPRTPTSQAAADLAAEAAPAYLLNHSYRTYLFGRCIVPEPEVDDEAAFVAAMIHDLGLTDAYAGESEFARAGADLACRFLEGRGWDLERIQLVEEAILRHTNLVAEQVPVVRLVQAGAALDVAGLGREGLASDDLAEILTAYPRLDFASSMRNSFLDEAHRHPEGAFAQLERAIALSGRFGSNPIDAASA